VGNCRPHSCAKNNRTTTDNNKIRDLVRRNPMITLKKLFIINFNKFGFGFG